MEISNNICCSWIAHNLHSQLNIQLVFFFKCWCSLWQKAGWWWIGCLIDNSISLAREKWGGSIFVWCTHPMVLTNSYTCALLQACRPQNTNILMMLIDLSISGMLRCKRALPMSTCTILVSRRVKKEHFCFLIPTCSLWMDRGDDEDISII